MIPKVLASTFLIINLLVTNLFAVNPAVADQTKNQVQNLFSDLSVGQFIALDFDQMHESKSVKINWIQKSIFKAAQKRLAKKVAKGKIDTDSYLIKDGEPKGVNRRGMLSLIFGGASFLFLLLPPLGVLSLPLVIAGLILGIKGVKKDKSDTMAIIGIVLGSLFILMLVVWAIVFSVAGGLI